MEGGVSNRMHLQGEGLRFQYYDSEGEGGRGGSNLNLVIIASLPIQRLDACHSSRLLMLANFGKAFSSYLTSFIVHMYN